MFLKLKMVNAYVSGQPPTADFLRAGAQAISAVWAKEKQEARQ